MKILFVSLFLPCEPATHAGGKHVYRMIRSLAEHHEIHLATRLEQGEEQCLPELEKFCVAVHPYLYPAVINRNAVGTLRLVVNYLGFSRFADQLIREGNYDLVQVEWVETALLISKGKTSMLLDAHDVITKPAERRMRQRRGAGRLLAGLMYVLVKAVELWIMRRFDTIFTLSEYDRDYLLRAEPKLKVKTVPIPAGLDITDRLYEPKSNSILFLASYKYRRVNVDAALWFYREVFPLVRERIPDARFIIAGYGPPEELTSLAALDPQVLVPGFVDDIDRCYKEAAVFVAPILTGGGIIVKILDALAAGRPVVTTSYGNEGIGAEHGRDLLVADDPTGFAEGVVRLLTEAEFARGLAANGREFVRKNYSLDSVISRIETSYAEIVKRNAA